MACLSVGTNDVLFAWDAEAFAARLGRIVEVAGASADRVVVPTITLSLARFPGGGRSSGTGSRRRTWRWRPAAHS